MLLLPPSTSMDRPFLQRCVLLPHKPFSALHILISLRSTGWRWIRWPSVHCLVQWSAWTKSPQYLTQGGFNGLSSGSFTTSFLSSALRKVTRNDALARSRTVRSGLLFFGESSGLDMHSRFTWFRNVFKIIDSLSWIFYYGYAFSVLKFVEFKLTEAYQANSRSKGQWKVWFPWRLLLRNKQRCDVI